MRWCVGTSRHYPASPSASSVVSLLTAQVESASRTLTVLNVTAAPDAATDATFGWSLAHIGGDVAVVGAPGDNETGVSAGSMYLFNLAPPGSAQLDGPVCKVAAPAPISANALFGYSVASAGGMLLIGAPDDLSTAAGMAGAVVLFPV